ncbi:MAG: COG1361 S-layer family protein [Methanosarcinales archaeon]|nr:COG1361 S-layer family protein [Methanosarcinales archaeon]
MIENKQMKILSKSTALIFILTLILIVPCATARGYDAPANANLQILAAEINPQPARPGEDMFVKINIENYANDPALDVVIELEEIFPFHLKYSSYEYGISKHNTNTTITIPKISAFGSYEALYFFTVDPQARSGEYELSFKIASMQGRTIGSIKNIRINIEGDPDLVLKNSSISSGVITPGDEFIFSTDLTSVGTGNSKNIRVSLELDQLPQIIPLDDSSRFIQELDAQESETVSFRLKVASDSDPTSYNIPIIITGTDETQNYSVTSTEVIGLDVRGKAKLTIANIKTDPLLGSVDEEMTLMIRIENAGEGDAKSVKVAIADLPFPGIKEAFLGKIEADDDSPAVFTLIPDKGGEFTYSLVITYEDDFGEHTSVEELNLMVNSKNGGIINNIVLISLFSLICIGLYYFKKKEE